MKRLLLILVPLTLFAQVQIDTVIRFPSGTLLQTGFFVPELNKLFIYTSNSRIEVLDCSTYQARTPIPYPETYGIAEFTWNWRRQKLYLGGAGGASSQMVIDAVTDSVLGWLPTRTSRGAAYSSEFDLLYTTCGETLYLFDCAADTIVHKVPTPVPGRSMITVSVDSVGRKLYIDLVAWGEPPLLAAYDCALDSFVAIMDMSSVGASIGRMHFDYAHRKAYFGPGAPPPYNGYAGVIDTERDTLLKVFRCDIGLGHLEPIAMNTRDEKVYIAGTVGGDSPETLWVVDCATDSVLKKVEYIRGWGSYRIKWVPWSNRIYLDCDHDSCLVVLDCRTDSIIIPRLQLGYWGAANIEIDPIRERIFVIGAESATVHVLRDVEAGVAEPGYAEPAPAPSGLQVHRTASGYDLRYDIASPCRVVLTVHDLLGREVRRFVAGSQAAGEHRVLWDRTDQGGAAVAQGVYLARLDMPGLRAVEKLVVQR